MEDTNQMQETLGEQPNELKLNHFSIDYLNETRKWAKFLAILLFIGAALMIIAGIGGLIAGSITDMAKYPGSPMAATPLIMIVFIGIVALYFIPANYLYQFSKHMKHALMDRDEVKLAIALKNLKSHYKFIGILAIILIAFYLIMLVFMFIVGASSLYQRI